MGTSKNKKFQRILVANRGEIAVRVARTVRELGMTPLAVFSDPDRCAPHVRIASEAVRLGPAAASESYLRAELILDAAKRLRADAIHPGYGFLSENAAFVEAVEAEGITFIGPSPAAMRSMGSKTAARKLMIEASVPVVPGTEALDCEEDAQKAAAKMGFPVMLKASAGGGGKGMRLVFEAADLGSALRAAKSEARSAFGDDAVYMEKAIIDPRHIEIQIFSDHDGNHIWLGERECSMQRRHQKVIEETPSPVVDDALREKMGTVACRAAAAVDYVGAGTVEFLLDQENNFYFLEMNTRLQVEHPVTEMCTGLDLVAKQIKVAAGAPLGLTQEQVERKGHAIEARLYAEDPSRGFIPSPGMLHRFDLPHGPGVRVDSGFVSGNEVSGHYDPMIAKIIAWGEDRNSARRRLIWALRDTVAHGIVTNRSFLQNLLASPDFISGDYHTGSIASWMEAEQPESEHKSAAHGSKAISIQDAAQAAMVVHAYRRDRMQARQTAASGDRRVLASGWRHGPRRWRAS